MSGQMPFSGADSPSDTLGDRIRWEIVLLETTPDPAWLKDAQGHFLAVNAAWCRLFGIEAEKAMGKTVFDCFPTEVAKRLSEEDRFVIQSRQLLRVEVLLSDKDGRPVWFETIKAPVCNARGDVVGTSGLARDVSERKRAAEADRRLAAIVNGSDDAIFSKSLDGIILTWNAAAERIYGYSATEAIGKPISILVSAERGDEIREILARIAGGGSISHYETWRRRKDGGSIHVSLTVSPLFDDDGRIVGASTIAHDISERKRADSERQIVIEFLRWVNASHGTHALVQRATAFIQEQSGCEAVGIRLREGDDYPYYETHGFPQKFVRMENSLCARDENDKPLLDGGGNPVLDCMCGNVICGRFDASKSFFTSNGSFWTNSTTDLLASTTDEDRQARTRNRCNGEGYESVALIPLVSGKSRLGLLQLNDHRRGCFTIETIALWERLAGYLAVALAKSQAEETQRESEQRYRALFDQMTEGFALHEVLCDERGKPCDYRFLDINPAFERMTGLQKCDVIGRSLREVLPGERHEWVETYGKVALTGQSVRFESYSDALAKHFAILAYCPAPRQFAVIFTDITDRRRAEQEKLAMERRLFHAQKLESLGILAGGVAHDFNNILAGIMGYTDLIRRSLPSADPVQADLEVIKAAAQRAADLTRQMLAYAGKGKFVVGPVNLSRLVEETRKMLDATLSKKAVLKCNLAADLPAIHADASQIHQVVLNLVINASEALGDNRGVIAVSTNLVDLDRDGCAAIQGDGQLREGSYVRLEVADTGCGMDEETLRKIFDPFFTTKFTGRGLGLAAVHGIVRGHKGALQVSSEPGKGTTFRVHFPAHNQSAPPAIAQSAAANWRGSGTLLVVDDEPMVRTLAKRMIEPHGFAVLLAGDGQEAVRLYGEHQHEIACVLLDLTMPKMNGEETLHELRKIHADVRVILSSGFSEEAVTERFAGQGLAGFIQKPYQLDAMTAVLRSVVEKRVSGP